MLLLFASLWLEPDPEPVDEAEVVRLLRQAQVGNVRATQRLYQLHVARVYRATRGVCVSDADAEELTHDAFVDALSNLARFSPRPGARFVGWLVTLALNRARKRNRMARAESTEPPRLEQLAGADPDALDEVTLGRRRALLAALAQLPERDRQVVSLFYGAELTADEVAQAVGVSAANVRKICERQRERLLSLLREAA